MEILKNISGKMNKAMDNISSIEKQLFTVEDIPMVAPKEGYENPNGLMIYTSDGLHLGNTGTNYESIQPKDFFDSVVNSVRDAGLQLDLSKLTFSRRKGSRIIEFRLPTEVVAFKNKAGKMDSTELFLNFETGFGGNAVSEVGLFSHRFVCSNGLKIINSEILLKKKHTSRMNKKVLLFTEQVIKAVSEVEATKGIWKEMNSVAVNAQTEEAFARQLANIKKDEKIADLHKKTRDKYDAIKTGIATEFSRTGSTVWGLLNGATYYSNHLATNADDADYILNKAGKKFNDNAQKLALALI